MHRRDLTPPRLPRLLRLAGAAVLSAVLLGTPAVAEQAPASLSATVFPSGTVTATVGAANDGVLLLNQNLQLSVAVRNGTTQSVDAATVSVALSYATLDSRAELQAWLDAEADNDTDPVQASAEVRLLPSSTAEAVVTVPVEQIPFSNDRTALGAHAVLVTITDPDGVVSTARTAVELTESTASPQETGVNVLVPLTVPDTAAGLLSADTLREYTQPTGTLSRQLDSVFGRAVTIGVDPRVLASIRVLGGSAPDSAVTWLRRLEVAPNDVFALPYADADIAAQAQAGLDTLLTPTSFEYGIDNIRFTDASRTATPAPATGPGQPGSRPERPSTESLLSLNWSSTVGPLAWPMTGSVRTADLDVYAASGLTRTIVSSDDLTLPKAVDTATRAVVDGHELVVADGRLSTGFSDAVSATTDSTWRARMSALSAELAQVQREGTTPDVVLALDRGSALDGTRLAQTLDALDALPWAQGTSFGTAMTAPATDGVTIADSAEPAQRLRTVKDLLATASLVDSFSAVLREPDLLRGKSRNDLLALLAVAWHDDDTGWEKAVEASRKLADGTLSSVRVESSDSVLQLSHDSSIPVYVRNDLPWPVEVQIDASTSNAVLDIDEESIKPASIDAGSQGRLPIPVRARVGNGETQVRVQLTALDGTPIGIPTSVVTSVRADWETVGTLVLGILLVVVFGVGILRNIRRRRRGETPEDEEDPNAPLAVQPGLDDRTDPRG
ncbi:DUF6049 family protein [Rathayibacter iranicus]|nr:DUF6049 family protein [Rathayibacter iranicus]